MKILNKKFSRRSALQVCGGSAILAYWLESSFLRAQGEGQAKRLVVMQRPNGSIREDWLEGNQLGAILQPLEPVWDRAVALTDIIVRPSNGSTGGSHESGLLTQMTGARLGPTQRTNDDFASTAESLDQTLVKKSDVLGSRPVKSLQLGAHGEQDGGNEVPNVTMSYSGANSPLYPVLDPAEVYDRLFADLMPGDQNMEELARRRARRQSVLDFVRGGLQRANAQFPADLKEDLEIHATAVRELEQALDANMEPTCADPGIDLGGPLNGNHENMERVANLHFALMTAAFQCDLTSMVTFQWATGASRVSFNNYGVNNHHSTSHANDRPELSNIDRWFSEKTLKFIQALVDSDDPAGGKLIDNTLVWYMSEVSEGWNHSFDDYPYVFFGGDNVGLTNRGRVVSGQEKTSNDVWSAIAPAFGTTLDNFETEAKGAVSGLIG